MIDNKVILFDELSFYGNLIGLNIFPLFFIFFLYLSGLFLANFYVSPTTLGLIYSEIFSQHDEDQFFNRQIVSLLSSLILTINTVHTAREDLVMAGKILLIVVSLFIFIYLGYVLIFPEEF